jgi:hypothetical protein
MPYTVTLLDSDPSYVHAETFPDKESMFEYLADLACERLEDTICDDGTFDVDDEKQLAAMKGVIQAIRKKDVDALIKPLNSMLYYMQPGDGLEVEHKKGKVPKYRGVTYKQVLQRLSKAKV